MVVHSSPLQFSFTFYLFFTPSLPSQFSWRPGGTLRWHSISGWIPTVSFCAFRRIKNTFRCKKFVLIIMSVENVLSQNYTTLFPVRGHWMLVKCGRVVNANPRFWASHLANVKPSELYIWTIWMNTLPSSGHSQQRIVIVKCNSLLSSPTQNYFLWPSFSASLTPHFNPLHAPQIRRVSRWHYYYYYFSLKRRV